ncbi:pimeloyl-ACP methyl ester esterase BioH [Candidatus Providencia siddallii]|uniref:Pimeloyl-[acyl-carrier protein] methyl ester esterase n=1 Tax=Candidatus Providencia siddallii TaxID=1715285 RepID=A0ABM9NNA5_9GAMM
MTNLYWRIIGKGKQNIILLHGWGLNSQVWNTIIPKISSRFRIYLIDLPGYGVNYNFSPMNVSSIANIIWENAPKDSIWLGWSFGGLVASRIAIDHYKHIKGLITVASSPYFISDKNGWPGISKEVISNFENQLIMNYKHTIEHFLMLQTFGTLNSQKDIYILKNAIIEQPIPTVENLSAGIKSLRTEDLRKELKNISVPFLRIYGYLDSLVPRKVSILLDNMYPKSSSIIMRDSAHAPFISHPDEFSKYICNF